MTTLESNIAARLRAEVIIELIGSESPRFWECLAELVNKNVPMLPVESDPRKEPMDDAEAARFEKVLFPWGAHVGEEIGSVATSYLIFIAEGDEFTKRLRRYVASKMFAQRQEDESE